MGISRQKFLDIADICMIEIGEEAVDSYLKDLNRVIDSVDKMQGIDISKVPMTFNTFKEKMNLREDTVKDMFSQEESLMNAFKKTKDYFEVPKILDSFGKDE